jgi:hypothetical protein
MVGAFGHVSYLFALTLVLSSSMILRQTFISHNYNFTRLHMWVRAELGPAVKQPSWLDAEATVPYS